MSINYLYIVFAMKRYAKLLKMKRTKETEVLYLSKEQGDCFKQAVNRREGVGKRRFKTYKR